MAAPTARRFATGGAFALALLLSACGGGGAEPGGTDTPTDTPTTLEPTDGPSAGPTDTPGGADPDDPAVRAAVDDLAERAGVDPAEIEIGPLEDVTWRDGSIGCPQPGMSYTQALVPGSRLVLTVDGTEYAYHAEEGGELFYCADPVDPAPDGDMTS